MNTEQYLRLIAAMVADIHKSTVTSGEIDSELVTKALWHQEEWAIFWKHDFLFQDAETPEYVKHVADVLDMWNHIENSYEQLSETDKARFLAETKRSSPPRFPGFDGNEETDYYSAARTLIDDLNRFTSFAGRDLNSHHPTEARYKAMLAAYLPIRDLKAFGDPELTADDLIGIFNIAYH